MGLVAIEPLFLGRATMREYNKAHRFDHSQQHNNKESGGCLLLMTLRKLSTLID